MLAVSRITHSLEIVPFYDALKTFPLANATQVDIIIFLEYIFNLDFVTQFKNLFIFLTEVAEFNRPPLGSSESNWGKNGKMWAKAVIGSVDRPKSQRAQHTSSKRVRW